MPLPSVQTRMKRSRCPCVGRQTGGQDVGVVVDVNRRGDAAFPQRLRNQILHVGALELAEIGRLLDEAAVDDARQPDADGVHGLSGRHRLNLLGETLCNSLGGQAEQRFVFRTLLVDPQLSYQLVPFHQSSGDIFGGGDSNCPTHVFLKRCLALPPVHHFASLFSPLNAAAL